MRRYRVEYGDTSAAVLPEPPFLLVSNHVSTFDPFWISRQFPYHIHWVTSRANYRNALFSRFLNRVGTVSKVKMVNDTGTIRGIREIIGQGGVVGIFHEGERTWNGRTGPPLGGTARLIRLLGVPVVFTEIRGGYYSLPRWARRRRRGRVRITWKQGLSREAIAAMETRDIHNRLAREYTGSDDSAAGIQSVSFRSRRRAEYLELVLFTCPVCGCSGTLRSGRNRFSCTCGMSVLLDRYYQFKSLTGHPVFSTLWEWDDWQVRFWKERLVRNLRDGEEDPELIRDEMVLLSGRSGGRMRKTGRGTARLYGDRIEAAGRVFPLKDLAGFHVQGRRNLVFYQGKIRYLLHPLSPRTSGYRWMVLYRLLSFSPKG